LNNVSVAEDEQNSVVHQGRVLIRPVRQGPRPGDPQFRDIISSDLLERAESNCRLRAPPSKPIAARWVLQNGVRDGRYALEGIGRHGGGGGSLTPGSARPKGTEEGGSSMALIFVGSLDKASEPEKKPNF
jgi:hypothetical protein